MRITCDILEIVHKAREAADKAGEINAVIVLRTLEGSIKENTDFHFAKHCQQYAMQRLAKDKN